MRRFTWLYLLLLFFSLTPMRARAVVSRFSDELDALRYDCTLTLTPPSDETAAEILLESDGKAFLRLYLTRQELRLEYVSGKRVAEHGHAPLNLKAGDNVTLMLMRRGDALGVMRDETFLLRGSAPHGPGALGEVLLGKGWTLNASHVQRLEPVVFADNFMRTADEPGQWIAQRGAWGLLSAWDRDPKGGYRRFATIEYAQNPFAWAGKAGSAGVPTGTEAAVLQSASALCTAGQPHWEDYTLTAAVCPAANGAAGVMVNMPDASHGILVRWSPANDASPTGDRLVAYRVDGEKLTSLGESRGGYLPGQWYKLVVTSSLDGLRVAVDGRERLALRDVTPWRGGIGLYCEGANETIFDDVSAYGSGVQRDLLAEHVTVQLSARYQLDHKGMAQWAASANDWLPHPAAPAYSMNRWDYFGDHWLSMTVTPVEGAGSLELILNNDGKDPVSGYRAVLKQDAAGKLTCALYDGAKEKGIKTLDRLQPKTAYGIRLRREADHVTLELDGDPVLSAKVAATTGLRPVFHADGAFSAVSELGVIGHNVLDYTFADAPTDWLAEGTWMSTTRWSCSPQWSFLGGWSRGDAVLWHKMRFAGDQSFEVYMAPKMEYPREHQSYEFHFRDLAITICGDGHHPRTGYTAIYGKDGDHTVLLRDGVEIAAAPNQAPFYYKGGHTAWYGVGLHKRGATITLTIGDKSLLTFTDPRPIDGGVPAIWTQDNGVAVARARLHFANAPTPRMDPQVTLDNPWYPDWADIGRPLALRFPGAIATSGKATNLTVTARDNPAGEGAPAVNGSTVTITPQVAGNHWYEIRATDGDTASPGFHVALPVFAPALGRDDSHALVLYRFDEGNGAIIHDQSAVKPAADLVIPANATAAWLPGQGLSLHGINRIATPGSVSKLMALAKSRAATFEFWLTADTIFPPTDWLGYLLSWEKAGNPAQNLAIAQISSKVLLIPDNTIFLPHGNFLQDNMQTCALFSGYHTGLQHIVFTWDGTLTRAYLNGVKLGERRTPWKPDGWSPDAQLMLGNQLNIQERNQARYVAYLLIAPYIMEGQGTGPHAFLGTFYLVAIHDRCFTDADVQRHYQAGPGAK